MEGQEEGQELLQQVGGIEVGEDVRIRQGNRGGDDIEDQALDLTVFYRAPVFHEVRAAAAPALPEEHFVDFPFDLGVCE